MFKFLYEGNVVFYMIGILTLAGIATNILYRFGYIRLFRAVREMPVTNDTTIKAMRIKYEEKCKKQENVYNVDSFVDRYVYNYKFCGLKLLTIRKISGQLSSILLTFTLLSSIMCAFYQCGQDMILSTICLGILTFSILEIIRKNVDNIFDSKIIFSYAVDYLENTIRPKYSYNIASILENITSAINKSEHYSKEMNIALDNSKENSEKKSELDTRISPKEKVLRVNKIDNNEKNKFREKNKKPDMQLFNNQLPKTKDNKIKEAIITDENTNIEENSIINEILREFLA